jgi:formylmethanofuran dehydrogenase subunit C
MENKIDEQLLETKSEMKEMKSEILELKSEMKREFKTINERMDRFENQMLHGFREIKLYVENRNKELSGGFSVDRKSTTNDNRTFD